jgi:hypothetical protein
VPAADPAPADGWAGALAAELTRLGVPVRPGCRVGAWRLDLCVGPADTAVAVICDVHPDGPAAHLDRARSLHRNGWRVHEVFASRWSGDPVRGALEIASLLGG